MKRPIIIITLLLGILTTAFVAFVPVSFVDGPSNADAYEECYFEIWNPSSPWDIWVKTSETTCSYVILNDDGMDITIRPTSGGKLVVDGMSGGSALLDQTCYVKPRAPMIDGSGSVYVYTTVEFEIVNGPYDDYDWSVSGACASIDTGGDGYDYADVTPACTGIITVKCRGKQNGQWSDWRTKSTNVY